MLVVDMREVFLRFNQWYIKLSLCPYVFSTVLLYSPWSLIWKRIISKILFQ